MRIAVVHNQCLPYRHFLFRALAARFEIDFFFFNQQPSEVPADLQATIQRGYRIPYASAYFIVPGLRRALRRRRYNLIVGGDIGDYNTATAYGVARHTGTPFVPWSVEWNTIRHPRRLLRRPFEQQMLLHSAGIIVPGVRHIEFLTGRGIPAQKLRRVPNIVDYEAQPADPAHPLYGRLAPLKSTGTLVCAIGRHVAFKGHGQLLRAQGRLEQAERDGGAAAPHLVIAGNGPLLAQNKALARRLALRKAIFIEEFVGDAAKHVIYDLCDIFVLPSTRKRAFEAWGLVCNEALAHGKPMVVTTAVGAAGEVVREGINGFIVADKDIAALASALGRLSGDPALRAQFGQGSLSLRADYAPQVMIDAFSEVIASCAAP
ncbi:MAG: glycosyltransferase family 4 protein [Candidatus Lambdaproteobacteria bacterium]|nr:glycosyltransferase family 4 protein [Candidatus Lambdaproteobacteria bacterium]